MARKLIPPTEAEDKKINRGIALDPDNPEWTDEDFARARRQRTFYRLRYTMLLSNEAEASAALRKLRSKSR